jgi:hypothetical protein
MIPLLKNDSLSFSNTPSTTTRRRHWKRLLPVAVAGAIVAAAITAWDNGEWRLNLSPSEPMGIWSVTPMTPGTRLQVGDVVTLCPRLPHGYHYGWLEDNTHAANACARSHSPGSIITCLDTLAMPRTIARIATMRQIATMDGMAITQDENPGNMRGRVS